LTPFVKSILQQTFAQAQWAAVTEILDSECGSNLPLIESQGVSGIERVQCAALKISSGSLQGLRRAIKQAQVDWRDVLVAAGFANDATVHLQWKPEGPPRESPDNQ
jgi:hypothetical protein